MLKLCLLCASDDSFVNYGVIHMGCEVRTMWWVECRSCGARSGNYKSKEEAREAWNARHGGV